LSKRFAAEISTAPTLQKKIYSESGKSFSKKNKNISKNT